MGGTRSQQSGDRCWHCLIAFPVPATRDLRVRREIAASAPGRIRDSRTDFGSGMTCGSWSCHREMMMAVEKEHAMGDKGGKKDKAKSQKTEKEQQEAKRQQDNQQDHQRDKQQTKFP